MPSLAALVGELERMKSLLWIRMSVSTPASPRASDPLEELRHLTPSQVAELLNLTDAYVHELCRSRRLPAVKQGKYWIIPVGGLRSWLAQAAGQLTCSDAGERSLENVTRAPAPLLRTSGRTMAPLGGRVRGGGALADPRLAATRPRRQRRPVEEAARESSGRSDATGDDITRP